MGLYVIQCPSCNKGTNWFSWDRDQRCEECKKPIRKTYRFNGIDTDEDGSPNLGIPPVIDGHLPLKAGDSVEFPGVPKWTAQMEGLYLFGYFMMGPLETYVLNGEKKEFGYGAVAPLVPVVTGDTIDGFLAPAPGFYNIRSKTFKIKQCLECGAPAEAHRYLLCKACWWVRDPRNPNKLS